MSDEWCTKKAVADCEGLFNLLQGYLAKEAEWVFRGHSSAVWTLETAIERLRQRFDTDWKKLPEYEWKLIREFKRRAHIYCSSPPEDSDHLEWLALLRHHGGPTRLLDFSFSPFIATYFALKDADDACAVWAINNSWLRNESRTFVTKHLELGDTVWDQFRSCRDGTSFEKMFWNKRPFRFVSSANPMCLNERLTLQQGLFLCPGDLTASFVDNLRMNGTRQHVHKIVVRFRNRNEGRAEALARLRKMNIDSTTLFAGLDGFAQSLNTRFMEIGELSTRRCQTGSQLR